MNNLSREYISKVNNLSQKLKIADFSVLPLQPLLKFYNFMTTRFFCTFTEFNIFKYVFEGNLTVDT